MKRESGFYWATINGRLWRIAHWVEHEKSWYITGSQLQYSDFDFKEIDPTPITRNDKNDKV